MTDHAAILRKQSHGAFIQRYLRLGGLSILEADDADAPSDSRATYYRNDRWLEETEAGLTDGTAVRVHGLKAAPQLNNLRGTCESFDESTSRWHVKLSNGEVKALKIENLQVVDQESIDQAAEQDAAAKKEVGESVANHAHISLQGPFPKANLQAAQKARPVRSPLADEYANANVLTPPPSSRSPAQGGMNSNGEPCGDFFRGKCTRGEFCRYSHGDAPAGRGNNMTEPNPDATWRKRALELGLDMDMHPKQLKKMVGEARYGENSNGEPCGDFFRGKCTRGYRCRFSHGDAPAGSTSSSASAGCPPESLPIRASTTKSIPQSVVRPQAPKRPPPVSLLASSYSSTSSASRAPVPPAKPPTAQLLSRGSIEQAEEILDNHSLNPNRDDEESEICLWKDQYGLSDHVELALRLLDSQKLQQLLHSVANTQLKKKMAGFADPSSFMLSVVAMVDPGVVQLVTQISLLEEQSEEKRATESPSSPQRVAPKGSIANAVTKARSRSRNRGQQSRKNAAGDISVWLKSLDAAGSLLRYSPALIREFGNIFGLQSAMTDRPSAGGKSPLQCIEPELWKSVGVVSLGHRLLIAKGIVALSLGTSEWRLGTS